MKCCSHPNIFDLVLGEQMQPGSCMIIHSRQIWKEGEYVALLILLGTNNLLGKW